MTQASAEEDGVSWIEDTGGPTCTETVTSMDSANLTPAEVSFVKALQILSALVGVTANSSYATGSLKEAS